MRSREPPLSVLHPPPQPPDTATRRGRLRPRASSLGEGNLCRLLAAPERLPHLGGAGGRVVGSLVGDHVKGGRREAGLFICFLKSVPEIIEEVLREWKSTVANAPLHYVNAFLRAELTVLSLRVSELYPEMGSTPASFLPGT